MPYTLACSGLATVPPWWSGYVTMSDAEDRNRGAEAGATRASPAATGVGTALVDLEGRWRDANPALERLLGQAPGALNGRALWDHADPDDADALRALWRDVVADGRDAVDAPVRYRRADGSVVWAQLGLVTLRDADGRPAYRLAQLRDLGAQRRAEALLREREHDLAECRAQLQTGYREQDVFAYGVSHNLRASARAIDGFAALLTSRLAGDGHEHLERIRGATVRMTALIDNLLEYSRVSRVELKCEAVDISLLADWAAVELIDAAPGREAAIDVQPGIVAYGDERQLRALVAHLLRNAWTFSAARERVDIAVSGRREGDRVHIAFRDHGSGFDMRYADKLFEPFRRLHGPEEGAGDGIGLAIAERIAVRHGGRLWAESEPGVGSVFHLELPAQAPAPPTDNPT